jgi:hypothetical protein
MAGAFLGWALVAFVVHDGGQSKLTENFLDGTGAATQAPPMVAPLATLTLANATGTGSRAISLQPCAELGAHAVLGVGVDSASEEYARLGMPCSCAHAVCVLETPLQFPHGQESPVLLMPDSFQQPRAAAGAFRQDGWPYPKPELPSASNSGQARAAAIAVRAQRWVSLNLRTLSSGPDKYALRTLLFALGLFLLAACLGSLLVRVLSRLRVVGKP